jgi:hypothetical protein
MFITLFYRDIFKYSQFLLAHLPLQVHTNVQPVQIVDLEDCRIYGKMTIGNWWWDMQDQIAAEATVVPVISESN